MECKKNPMGLVESLDTQSQSGCLGFDQELPSSSQGTNTLKKLTEPAIFPAMGPPVMNSDQSLVESFEETLWETKKEWNAKQHPNHPFLPIPPHPKQHSCFSILPKTASKGFHRSLCYHCDSVITNQRHQHKQIIMAISSGIKKFSIRVSNNYISKT